MIEMRKDIDNWKKSKKYALLKAELTKKKQNLLNLKIELMEQMDEGMLTKIELTQLIQIIKECEDIDDVDIEDIFDIESFIAIGDAEDILVEYIQRQVVWFTYLVVYLSVEDFEMCSEIRDIINLYERKLIRIIQATRNDILLDDEQYIERIMEVNEKLFKTAAK